MKSTQQYRSVQLCKESNIILNVRFSHISWTMIYWDNKMKSYLLHL